MKNIIYILAFLEGIAVMAIELISARLLAPFFGGSLYVITAVLGITMFSLLIGYFLGGQIVAKNKHNKYALPFIIIASAILCLMPLISTPVLKMAVSLGLTLGAIFSVLVLIGLPLILLGAVSPQLVQQLSDHKIKAGTASGNIYSISTLGGVIGTFIVGLYAIPTLGIKLTAIIFGGICAILPLLLLLSKKQKKESFASLTFLTLSIVVGYSFDTTTKVPLGTEILYTSDGLLGKMEVVEVNSDYRSLVNNGMAQSMVETGTYKSLMTYTHVISTLSSLLPQNQRNNVAILGLAGGSLIKEMAELNFKKINAIDIDKRTQKVAEEYFRLDKSIYNFIEDDGRHFLMNTKDTFDLIIIDVSASEQQPYHLYTEEAFKLYHKKLSSNGFIILNIIDFVDVGKAKITEKIGDGMVSAGFKTVLLKDFYPMHMMDPNIMEYFAHEKIIMGAARDFENISLNLEDLNSCCRKNQYNLALKQNFSQMSFLKNQITNTPFKDDCPLMEKMNFERSNLLRTKFMIK